MVYVGDFGESTDQHDGQNVDGKGQDQKASVENKDSIAVTFLEKFCLQFAIPGT